MSIQVNLLGKTPLTADVLSRVPPGSALVMVYLGEKAEEHIGLLVETTASGEEVPVKVVVPSN